MPLQAQTAEKLAERLRSYPSFKAKHKQGGHDQTDQPGTAGWRFPKRRLRVAVPAIHGLEVSMYAAFGKPGAIRQAPDALLAVCTNRVENDNTLGPQSHGVGPCSEGWLQLEKSALQSTRSTAGCPALRGCPEDEMTSVNAKQEALLDELLKDYTDPRDILGEHGLLKHLTKRVVERVLEAELTAHLGYAPHGRHGTEEQNTRHGKGHKTVQTDTGPLALQGPRDRNGSFAPQLVPKRQRRLEGFDVKVLSLYARGLSPRESQGHLEELYGTEVSPTLISTITDAVLDEVRTWQSRPLASVSPILYFDALFVKSREE